jgi:hypothetical protein
MSGCSQHSPNASAGLERSAKKQPIEIFVSAGDLNAPFYTFKNSKGKVIKNLKINPKKTYVFSREEMAESHPFYISDVGFNQRHSKAIKIKGDGSFDDGISGEESFQLSIGKKFRSDFEDSGQLFFYCTAHESMVGDFLIKARPTKSSDSDSSKEGKETNFTPMSDESETQSNASTVPYGNSSGGYSYRSLEELTSPDIVDVDASVA